jgi:hypothetical protein
MGRTMTSTLVQSERRDSIPMAFILDRGQYDKPGEKVFPATFKSLPPMPTDAPRNRLGLAQWLVAENNPLTARVTVNRLWQEVFGRGIVATPEDFGVMGAPPSHPKLLDWLAVEFRESGWDVKHMMRLMVTSATYRQSAIITPEKYQADPENRMLSRGPRFRLDAESIRDNALAVGGLLSSRIGGPSVKPYQPGGIWNSVSIALSDTFNYTQDHGESLYRRSLYTFWKRKAPPVSLAIYDAPTREVCILRRERTITPMQALVTLNDPQFVEAARQLATGALTLGGDTVQRRLDWMSLRLIARRFKPEELVEVEDSLRQLEAFYASHEADARRVVAIGESSVIEKIQVKNLAAWTVLANELLNLDEVFNK